MIHTLIHHIYLYIMVILLTSLSCHRKKLARRLLFDRSANEDHEKSILTKLKQQCGGQFTSKMEGMVSEQYLFAFFSMLLEY